MEAGTGGSTLGRAILGDLPGKVSLTLNFNWWERCCRGKVYLAGGIIGWEPWDERVSGVSETSKDTQLVSQETEIASCGRGWGNEQALGPTKAYSCVLGNFQKKEVVLLISLGSSFCRLFPTFSIPDQVIYKYVLSPPFHSVCFFSLSLLCWQFLS